MHLVRRMNDNKTVQSGFLAGSRTNLSQMALAGMATMAALSIGEPSPYRHPVSVGQCESMFRHAYEVDFKSLQDIDTLFELKAHGKPFYRTKAQAYDVQHTVQLTYQLLRYRESQERIKRNLLYLPLKESHLELFFEDRMLATLIQKELSKNKHDLSLELLIGKPEYNRDLFDATYRSEILGVKMNDTAYCSPRMQNINWRVA